MDSDCTALYCYSVLTRRFRISTGSIAAIMMLLTAGLLRAQGGQAGHAQIPHFEVTSVKPCDPKAGGRGGDPVPGRLFVKCSSVRDLITMAYRDYADGRTPVGLRLGSSVNPITGGPAWISSAFYEINAKPEGSPSPGMMRGPMLQGLLEDRFKLRIRREVKDAPVYGLNVAKGGFKLKPLADGGCVPRNDTGTTSQASGQRRCGGTNINFGRAGGTLELTGVSLAEFSRDIQNFVDRPVLDKTGIIGLFDFRLEFASDENTPGLAPGNPAAESSSRPSLFTALQEQLGLKLEAAKGPNEFLVIDSIERPSEN
jgi:uncharacterized protein (TIGR03435 family)